MANKGTKTSEETKLKMSNAQKGRTLSLEHRKKISEATRLAMKNPEIRKKISDALSGRKMNTKTKQAILLANKGARRSVESRKRMSNAQKGRIYSEETKQRLRALRLGTKLSESHKEALRQGRLSTPHSPETKLKMSLMKKGKPVPWATGKNHWRWIADRTQIKTGDRFLNDPLQKGWRKAVKDRDSWSCRIADNNCDGRLEAHHILTWKEYPELRYEINNGITLCQFHHPRAKVDVINLSPFFQTLVAQLD